MYPTDIFGPICGSILDAFAK